MSFEEIASNVFLFFVAASESTSSTVAYTIYELSRSEELLARAQQDVNRTLEEHHGELTYESIMEMKFIDLCVKETLRKYPALPLINRECTKDYQIPGSKLSIEKGTAVVISLLGIHRNEKFFPDPMKYNPDRFTEEAKAYNEDMYMPFGIGPRSCMGEKSS
jgi:cytochrome P450 family 6